MSKRKNIISDEELQKAVNAYYNARGNKAEAARGLGLARKTFSDRLELAERQLGVKIGKVSGGQIQSTEARQVKLPPKGHKKIFLLSSIQNNTELHPGFNNVLAYLDFLNDLPKTTCELLIGTYTYQKNAYGNKAVKRGTLAKGDAEDLWYAPEAEDYIVDESVELAPGLVWCGEQNILPTTAAPLARMETYNGRKSNIVPHAKITMSSTASMANDATKFNYSTGTLTQRNYIQKQSGILAEQMHDYGFLIVEVDSSGNWFVRQVYIAADDEILEIGPHPFEGLRVQAGIVTEEHGLVDHIYWGDVHVAELDPWVKDLCWGEGGMLDSLQPERQFMGDAFSMLSRGHHDIKNFHSLYAKRHLNVDSVEGEIKQAAAFLNFAERDYCETILIPDNHSRHLDRWLNEADFRKDLLNAKYFCLLQYQILDAVDRNDTSFNILQWAMEEAGSPKTVKYLLEDESFVSAGVECGLHGDLGSNGSRGSTNALKKLGRPVNKGHDHTAAISGRVFSAGACSLNFPYMKGPNSHSVSHIVGYRNGKRTLVTMWKDKWRA